MKVPFLEKSTIAGAAETVLVEYGEKTGREAAPPVPVEEIVGICLGLGFQYLDLERIIGVPGVLGATFVQKHLVSVDHSLLADRSQGRASFTLAHEAGHWVLHRQYVDLVTRQGVPDGAIFCRAKDAGRPIEWQADYFAACLLMPQKAVVEAFDRTFEPDRLEVFNIRETFLSSPQVFDICVDTWPHIARAVCEAGNFCNVSRQAMIIRLQELGLVVNQTSKAMGWNRSLMAA